MTRAAFNNGDTGLVARTAINGNFTQLYAVATQPAVSGRWLAACSGGVTVAGGVSSSASMWLYPFIITETTIISDLGMRVTTLGAGVTAMLGIYAHSTATGEPTGVALASVTGLSMAAAGAVSAALASNITLQPGMYWAAFQASGAVAIAQFVAATELGLICMASGAATLAEISSAATSVMLLKGIVNTYGTFPNLTGASLTATSARNGALLYYKVA